MPCGDGNGWPFDAASRAIKRAGSAPRKMSREERREHAKYRRSQAAIEARASRQKGKE